MEEENISTEETKEEYKEEKWGWDYDDLDE
jgi:hypothetical protein